MTHPNKAAGKNFERVIGELLGSKRFPADTGGSVDVEGEWFVAQCKTVQRMSLAELSRLAERAHQDGKERGKVGLVAIKMRAGSGVKTCTLLVMVAE